MFKYYMDDVLISPNNTYEKPVKNNILKSLMRNSPYCEIEEETNNLSKSSECIICFEVMSSPIVTCSLCSNYSHYKCYNKFIKKNKNYQMKCVHCGTRSLRFRKKWWQLWCCFGPNPMI